MKKVAFVILILLAYQNSAFCQNDSIVARTKLYHLDYAKMQYAGQIGFLSVGVGSELFRKRNGELDFFVGYLPESIGGDNIVTGAFKFAYIPWDISVFKHKMKLQPLTMGLMIFHAFGEDLNKIRDKDLYPQGYYWWSLGTRVAPVFGIRLKKELDKESTIKALAFYVEFVTNDLYIYSRGVNRTIIPLYKIFDSSIGVKVNF